MSFGWSRALLSGQNLYGFAGSGVVEECFCFGVILVVLYGLIFVKYDFCFDMHECFLSNFDF